MPALAGIGTPEVVVVWLTQHSSTSSSPRGPRHWCVRRTCAAVISGSQDYPPQAELDRELETQCSRAVPGSLAGAAVTGLWSLPKYFEPYANVFAECWMYDPDGRPLPPR